MLVAITMNHMNHIVAQFSSRFSFLCQLSIKFVFCSPALLMAFHLNRFRCHKQSQSKICILLFTCDFDLIKCEFSTSASTFVVCKHSTHTHTYTQTNTYNSRQRCHEWGCSEKWRYKMAICSQKVKEKMIQHSLL